MYIYNRVISNMPIHHGPLYTLAPKWHNQSFQNPHLYGMGSSYLCHCLSGVLVSPCPSIWSPVGLLPMDAPLWLLRVVISRYIGTKPASTSCCYLTSALMMAWSTSSMAQLSYLVMLPYAIRGLISTPTSCGSVWTAMSICIYPLSPIPINRVSI